MQFKVKSDFRTRGALKLKKAVALTEANNLLEALVEYATKQKRLVSASFAFVLADGEVETDEQVIFESTPTNVNIIAQQLAKEWRLSELDTTESDIQEFLTDVAKEASGEKQEENIMSETQEEKATYQENHEPQTAPK
jgi:uncharacterized protein with von Willebrand factor type A (vWA) domain